MGDIFRGLSRMLGCLGVLIAVVLVILAVKALVVGTVFGGFWLLDKLYNFYCEHSGLIWGVILTVLILWIAKAVGKK